MNIDARIASRKNSPYSHLLVFVREFIGGTCLAGTTHEDDLPFCSEADAKKWVSAINAKAERGKINYRVVEHEIVRLGR